MIWVGGVIVYTALSVWYFLSIMASTYHKDKWYDYLILFPTLAIIHIASAVVASVRWFK